jgi:nucleolin
MQRHLIRRAAFRAAASPATSFASKSRSINTSSPFLLRSRIQSNISPSVFRRFASDDANAQEQSIESADGEERGSVRSAIDSVTESASTYASDAAESISEHVNEVKESVYDGAQAAAAATGVAPNRERRPYNGDREERRPYNREGRGRSGYQEARRAAGGYDRGGDREAPDRVVRPTTGIYVGNLLFDVTAADLEKEFEPFGKIKSTVVAADARGLSKGYVFRISLSN